MKYSFAAATAVAVIAIMIAMVWADSALVIGVLGVSLGAMVAQVTLRSRELLADRAAQDRLRKLETQLAELPEPLPSLDDTERNNQKLVQRRRQRLESLGTLASGIVHDLNNLLTPILMSSRMLQREGVNIDRAALLETISSSASRGADLISQLLTFARGGEGRHVPIQIDQVLPDVIAILRHTLPDGVALQTEIEPGLPSILGDDTEIGQVLMNLAINSRDAISSKGTSSKGTLGIHVRSIVLERERTFSYVTLPPGNYVSVAVSDTGTGITPEVRERMFDPFFTTKARGQGTGLGLSTSLGIIRSHGGAVDVRSTVGQGTTITVLFPIEVLDSH